VAHNALSLRDFSRADIIVRNGQPVFIESSVAPGMTETSPVPFSLVTAGHSFSEILGSLVKQAGARG
jgi:D-alanine-D-alanine ligase